MTTIEVLVSTNASVEEKEILDIPKDAIEDFLNIGFCENVYDGKVSFQCLPRAVDPNFMEIIVDLKDLAETAIAWGTIFATIMKFCKRCKGYEHSLTIKRKKDNEEIEISIPINENSDCEKIIHEAKKLLK